MKKKAMFILLLLSFATSLFLGYVFLNTEFISKKIQYQFSPKEITMFNLPNELVTQFSGNSILNILNQTSEDTSIPVVARLVNETTRKKGVEADITDSVTEITFFGKNLPKVDQATSWFHPPIYFKNTTLQHLVKEPLDKLTFFAQTNENKNYQYFLSVLTHKFNEEIKHKQTMSSFSIEDFQQGFDRSNHLYQINTIPTHNFKLYFYFSLIFLAYLF